MVASAHSHDHEHHDHDHHDHDHHDHDHAHGHAHEYKQVAFRRLGWSLGVTLAAMVLEIIGGWLSGSIALISDAGHMLTHGFAIVVSMVGIAVARWPRCHHRTFGMLRAETLAAFVNGLFLLLVTAWILVESGRRLLAPREIVTLHMLAIALIGLLVNVVSIFLLEGSREGDLNVQSVFLHMIGDAASSVAIVVAAIVIHFTGWIWLDPVISVGIALWIAVWALGLLRESARVLLEMAPRGRHVHEITDALRERFPEILATSQERVWMVTPELIVFTARLQVAPEFLAAGRADEWLAAIERWLAETFDIAESTLQVSGGPAPADAAPED